MRILTNFTRAPDFLDLPDGRRAEITRAERWDAVRRLIPSADLIIIDCRDNLVFKLAARFLLFPWTRRRLVAVDLVLRKPHGFRSRLGTLVKRRLLKRVDHFIHYFKDISGYTKYFGISPASSSFVPFKVNNRDAQLSPADIREEYIFTMGRSLRDYGTFIDAVAGLPYPAAIPEFSLDDFEGKDASFTWTRANLPGNLTVLPDSGTRTDLVRHLAGARLVVIPVQSSSLCASGLSTYLDAMFFGKCVIVTSGPGTSDLLTDQALLVPPHDVAALKDAICRVWEDASLRQRIARSGQEYARSLGGEAELMRRIFQQALAALPADRQPT